MRIGIDARFFGPVGKGLGRYTERLIENLERVADDHEFVIFLRKENFDLYRPASRRFKKALADFRWYTLAEQLWYPPLIAREGIDLMHFPHFNVPVGVRCPFVVTIHDLILFRYPTKRASLLNPLIYGIKYAAYRFVISLAVRRARRVIVVSECTRKDVLEAFPKLAADRVDVTYEASDGVEAGQMTIPGASLPERKGVVKPYFLYVGNAYPHKNLEELLEAFRELRDEGLEAQLVLVGKSDDFYERLKKEAERLGLVASGDVVFYGFAEEWELAELYRRARVYVFPSLLEGFGLPPLEAMRYGTPVAASGSSCLPEILGEAAVYFDPRDRRQMKRTMLEVFSNESLRHRLAAMGRERVNLFSWKTCAKQTYAIYLRSLQS